MSGTKMMQPTAGRVILLLGQGFGLGRIPFAPGTFGTLPGLLLVWFCWQTEVGVYLVVTAAVLVSAISIAGRSAQMLGDAADPRIVIDEIAPGAMPASSLTQSVALSPCESSAHGSPISQIR